MASAINRIWHHDVIKLHRNIDTYMINLHIYIYIVITIFYDEYKEGVYA